MTSTHGTAMACTRAAVLLLVSASPAFSAGTIDVLYAGSLVNLMERSVAPAFDQASGYHFRGYAGGSKLLAHQIEGKLRNADVFISAVPGVNRGLMGSTNGAWVSWYVAFAESPVVIGYSRSSRFAEDFGTKPWYRVLQEAGIRIGRTDPKLDPKGALTLSLMTRAEIVYAIPGLSRRILGTAENSAQVLPEETLVGRLQSGQLDAGFFYTTETSDAKIPAIKLPAAITPKAVYTITILNSAPDPAAAAAFVAFLLGPQGRALMRQHGLALRRPSLTGNADATPPAVKALLKQVK